MDNLFETLELCKRLNAGYKPALSNSPVADCTRRFELLPLRYAAIGGSPALRARLPQLPGHLKPFQDIGDLTESSYAIRPLREGFLYLLVKRRSEPAHQWHSAWRIAPNGSLLYIRPDSPWEPVPSAASIDEILRGQGWTITLYDVDDIEELRPLYCPSPLTPRMLDNYRLLDEGYRSTLQSIDIERFIQPSDAPPQPHVLKHDQLSWIADFKAQHDGPLQALLGSQPFNTDQIVSMTASHHALMPEVGKIKPRGAAMVIEDAIGITQELNAWRNGAIDDVRTQWLQRSVELGVDNERKLLVAQSFLEVEKMYPEMVAEQIIKRQVMAETIRLQPQMPLEMYVFSDIARKADEEHDARMKPHLETFERETRERVEARLQAGEFKGKFDKKYGKLVDIKGMHDQLDYFDQVLAQAEALADSRASDHVYWARSERLLRALERYDSTDLISGLAFAEQTGRCIIGMELCVAGSTLLDQWWRSDPASPNNLAIRGITANQDDIREEVAALISAAKVLEPDNTSLELPESITQRVHAAANAFGRINTLYEHLQSQSVTPSVGLYAWYAVLGRQVLRTAAPNSMDRVLHHGLRWMMIASVSEKAVDVRLSDAARGDKVLNSNRTNRQATYFLDKAWAEGVMGAHKSDFYKVRVSALLCLLEGMLIAFKARKLPEGDARLISELAAMGFTIAGAGFELGASYVEQVVARTGANSLTGKGAEVVLGRLKLWGAGLAGVGGLVFAWWDFADGARHRLQPQSYSNPRSKVLSTAYFTRAIATLTLSAAEFGTAIAIAKPLFDYLTSKVKNKFILSFVSGLNSAAAVLGTQVARMVLSRIVLGAFWIGLVISLIIWLLDDDALEKWCKRSIYRLDRNVDSYEEEKELPELFSSLKGVV